MPIADAAPAEAVARTRGLRRVCDSLAANPVLHLSLGSRELFHSNFLGWLFQNNVDIARDALALWSEADRTQEEHDVRRECQNLDLIVNIPGAKPVVIENKVFSVPDEAQLDRYRRVNIPAVKLEQSTNLLLSLSDPEWADGKYRSWTWVPLSRPQPARGTSVRHHLRADPFIVRLVEHWVAMVADLQTIIDFVRPNDQAECLLLDADVVELLRSVRLHDAYQKFRTAAVRHRLE